MLESTQQKIEKPSKHPHYLMPVFNVQCWLTGANKSEVYIVLWYLLWQDFYGWMFPECYLLYSKYWVHFILWHQHEWNQPAVCKANIPFESNDGGSFMLGDEGLKYVKRGQQTEEVSCYRRATWLLALQKRGQVEIEWSWETMVMGCQVGPWSVAENWVNEERIGSVEVARVCQRVRNGWR